jgi:hypothetical protein
MDSTEKYIHHGRNVTVLSKVKGQHREYCLCFQCSHYLPISERQQCHQAALLFALSKTYGMVTPVFECAEFSEK